MSAVLTGPTINRGKSKQDYETPWEFIRAVEGRFGSVAWDLAADSTNFKGPPLNFYSEIDNALTKTWPNEFGLCWLNPPYANITEWAKKCDHESQHGCRIVMLVPASVGTEWFNDYVHRRAMVLAIRPRLTFGNCTDPYPKDLMLNLWNCGEAKFDTWRWK